MELIVDNFAGGGGASTGIELATGRSVDIAIDHDPAAIAMHRVNHPKSKHYCEIMTADASNRYGLVTAFISKYFAGGYQSAGVDITVPLPTVTCIDHNALVEAFLVKYYGQGSTQTILEPLHTITTKDRFGIVVVRGELYQIVDIGMRMLTPRELFRAQGFPGNYIIDRDADGKSYPKSAQVARCGNAVPPPFAEALVRANLPELCSAKERESA